MPESGRLARGWLLFTLSTGVLRKNKLLMLFPLAGLISIALLVALYAVPEILAGRDPAPTRAVVVAFYLLLMFFSTFTNVAFTHEALQAFNGNPVSLSRGFSFARRRLAAIALWSLFAGLVGLAISSLEQRLGFFGRIVVKAVGLGWSVASIFVIPVMIRDESDNPVALLRKSAGTLRKSWGQGAIGRIRSLSPV